MKSNFVPLFYSIILRTLRSPSVLGHSNLKNKRINVFPFLGHPVFVLISTLIKLLCKNSRTGTLLRILHAKHTLNMYVLTSIDENFYLTVTG